jgi:fucose 4-O-acetylase-like acetyltransferase
MAWIDYARAAGITLVVLGHAIRSADSAGLTAGSPLYAGLEAAIYSFHMPLFFILAGMTHSFGGGSGPAKALKSLFWGIVVPYLVWSIVWIALKTVFAGSVQPLPGSWNPLRWLLLEPVDQFWFLYVLVIVRLAWILVDLTGSPVVRRLAVVIPLAFALAGLGHADATLSRWLIYWAAFYGLGVILSTGWLDGYSRTARAGLAAAAAVVWAASYIGAGPLIDGTFGLARTGTAIAGSLAVLAAASLLPSPKGLAGRTAGFIGEATLAIFLTHTMVGVLTRMALAQTGSLTAETLVIAATLLGVALPALAYAAVLWAGLSLKLPLAKWFGLGTARRSYYIPLERPARPATSPL